MNKFFRVIETEDSYGPSLGCTVSFTDVDYTTGRVYYWWNGALRSISTNCVQFIEEPYSMDQAEKNKEFNIGDKVEVLLAQGTGGPPYGYIGKVTRLQGDYVYINWDCPSAVDRKNWAIHKDYLILVNKQKKENNMVKELVTDLRDFVKEHRKVIYTIAVVAIVDHFFFKGALRQRLQNLVEKMLSKAEKSVE